MKTKLFIVLKWINICGKGQTLFALCALSTHSTSSKKQLEYTSPIPNA